MEKISKKGWTFIAAYILGLSAFVMYEVIEKDNFMDGFGYNLPAGAHALVFFMAHVLSLSAAFLYAEGEKRRIILRSFALYVFLTGMLVLITPTVMGLIGGYTLFVLTGRYHIRFVDMDAMMAPFETKEENKEFSDHDIRLTFWLMISIMMFVLSYWNL